MAVVEEVVLELVVGSDEVDVKVVGSSPIKVPVVSLSKKLDPYCLVLVGSRNGFERDITIKLK